MITSQRFTQYSIKHLDISYTIYEAILRDKFLRCFILVLVFILQNLENELFNEKTSQESEDVLWHFYLKYFILNE